MSVYIPGMEMPKCCAECVALHDDGNSLTCLITHEPRGYMFPDTEERMSNCPLIPVPEHGRLIDESMIPWCVDWYAGRKRYYTTPKNIEHLPTIIPASEE